MNVFIKKFKLLCFLCIFFYVLCHRVDCAYADNELYFNATGDLCFTTYDKTASSGIRYRTVGWVIKRYNDVASASGQYSANIPKSGYQYQTVDPNNSDYVYTTFIMDGDMIMEKISSASSEWADQLKNYGGYVYIDSIMTVTEYGVDTGGLTDTGELTGECYNTYEGIRNARGWADGDKLKGYYDLCVNYPYIAPNMPLTYVDSKTENKSVKVGGESSFELKAADSYDVSQGIPSGENILLSGTADTIYYEIDYQIVTGIVYIPIEVVTDYSLKWTDTSGNARSETQRVSRWYYVQRSYEYTSITDFVLCKLSQADAYSDCFPDTLLGKYSITAGYSRTHYNGSSSHVTVKKSGSYYYTGTQVIQSTNNQRPSIPEEDYQSVADSLCKENQVRSDRLVIGSKLVLSDTKYQKKGGELNLLATTKQKISEVAIQIPADTLNQQDYCSGVKITYASMDIKKVFDNQDVAKITVHTPVAVQMTLSVGRDQNQSANPTSKDVVVGTVCRLSLTQEAEHRDIPGYGTRVYTKYAKNTSVRFPFQVQYRGTWYAENEWIDMGTNAGGIFCLPEDVKEGDYVVDCRMIAWNTPESYEEEGVWQTKMQEGANLDIGMYGAYGNCQIHVIGKLYGMTIENAEQVYAAGSGVKVPETLMLSEETYPMLLGKTKNTDKRYRLGVYTSGIGDEEGESVEIELSYFILEQQEDGETVRREVDVYRAEDENFTAATLVKMEELLSLPANTARIVTDGIYHYTYDLEIPHTLILVDKGQNIADIGMLSDYILRDRVLLIHLDIYGCENGIRKLSYENAENELLGYCNRWKKEGFNVDKIEDFQLKCGDVLLFDMEGIIKNSSHIIGTH